MENYALELRNITKTYPGVVALDKVSLGLKRERFMLWLEKMVPENLH